MTVNIDEMLESCSQEQESLDQTTSPADVDWHSGLPADSCQQEPITAVQQFFSGRCVLVTGATGFVGKVLIQKILRSLPGVDTVYALVRPKRGCSVRQRIENLLNEQVFCGLQDGQRRRLVGVSGDVSQPGLGLSPGDRETLCRRVSVVFHLAATVRFNEQLTSATATNVQGTREVLELARQMTDLKAVVHTSTAYSGCVSRSVPERVCPAPMSPSQLMALCRSQPDDVTDEKQLARILGSYPNTYTFTKATAERLIHEEYSELPVVIFRPSIVMPTSQEPFPGWVDTFHGLMTLVAAASTGLMRVYYCQQYFRVDMVPCDKVVHCLLAAAWDVAANRGLHRCLPPVYNFVSSYDSPLTTSESFRYLKRYSDKWPSSQAVWYYSLRPTNSKLVFTVLNVLLHLLPAIVFDSVAVLTGGNPRMRRIYGKLQYFSDVTSYYSLREWDFENANTKALWSRLSDADQRLLPFDLRGFDWDQYFNDYVRGVRQFLLKDDLVTLPAAKARWRRLLWLHRSVKLLTLVVMTAITWGVINIFV